MTTQQYLNALKRLGLSPHGVKTREALGLSARQLARLANGKLEPTPMLQNLITALLEKQATSAFERLSVAQSLVDT